MYEERRSRVAGAVVWSRRAEPAGAGAARVLPDGCMDLIWMDGGLVVAGPDTVAHLASGQRGADYVGIRFAPGTGPAVLGVPAVELRDRRVPLGDLWPGAAELAERMAEADDPGRLLEEVAAARLREAEPDPVARLVAQGLARGTGVAALAYEVGLSDRQLYRRSVAAFGYGAKTLGRVLRLGRALELARAGRPLAEVAATAGYADQAHLSREVRGLAGVPMGELLR
ncbi:helix-turn-helix domain-containing protein [Yinghuangia soli]|uniref:Helix-turn-helix domain-containing protein n=1 Tax=Yinghuangia soli TaxID=2908204 RepID=A0AA41Q7M7_9ACTN|nr:AraC family transcriptional regulator [Yinghuangia soli]MCF2533088.1 helix-turn-helix domain-containing protein [Yinghuangia soli]